MKQTKRQTTTEGFYFTGYSGFTDLRDGRYSADIDMGCKYIKGNAVVHMKDAAYVFAHFQGPGHEPRTYPLPVLSANLLISPTYQ